MGSLVQAKSSIDESGSQGEGAPLSNYFSAFKPAGL